MREQGFTEWEHLETHTDIYEASNREIELQKEYGLPVDKIPYFVAVQNRPQGMSKETLIKSKESKIRNNTTGNGGKVGGKVKSIWNRKLTQEQAEEIRARHIPNLRGLRASLAKQYNVSAGTIHAIWSNKIYI
tara:strand:+ start:130 stop:528 length:399 start_codon:yes stop_codon:yes gene_type:complete